MVTSHRDLTVWQKGVSLSIAVYSLTEKFPREEIYGLSSQMRRASVSIPSNIAEGRNRGTRKDFQQFLRIAMGSCAELETQIIISKQIVKTEKLDYTHIETLLIEVGKMLTTMIRNLDTPYKLVTKS